MTWLLLKGLSWRSGGMTLSHLIRLAIDSSLYLSYAFNAYFECMPLVALICVEVIKAVMPCNHDVSKSRQLAAEEQCFSTKLLRSLFNRFISYVLKISYKKICKVWRMEIWFPLGNTYKNVSKYHVDMDNVSKLKWERSHDFIQRLLY